MDDFPADKIGRYFRFVPAGPNRPGFDHFLKSAMSLGRMAIRKALKNVECVDAHAGLDGRVS